MYFLGAYPIAVDKYIISYNIMLFMFPRRHANDQSGCFMFFFLHYDTQPLISVSQICAFSDMGLCCWTVQRETVETSHPLL
jgi:hypothetical protein